MEKRKLNLTCVAGLLLSFIPIVNIVGIILCARGINQVNARNEDGKVYAITGLVVGTIEIVVMIIMGVSAYNYFVTKVAQTRRVEIVEVANQTVNKVYEQYAYDNQVGLIQNDTGYHIYNINNIGVKTNRTLNDYFGYVVVDATGDDYYEYILFVSSSELELVNYRYFEYGNIKADSTKIVKYNDKDMPHSAKDVCDILKGTECYGEDGLPLK